MEGRTGPPHERHGTGGPSIGTLEPNRNGFAEVSVRFRRRPPRGSQAGARLGVDSVVLVRRRLGCDAAFIKRRPAIGVQLGQISDRLRLIDGGVLFGALQIDQDLAGAGVCVIWSSAAGLRALQLGVPVVYTAPHWIGAEAASRGLGTVLAPLRDDAARLRAMRHAAWGQRTVAEIESGEPFATILEHLAEVKWS